MLPTLIVAGLVLLAAGLFFVLSRRQSVVDDAATGADAVLRQSLASVPANAFDARLRIVREA